MPTARYVRAESEAARLDRHWHELLQELRVAQTGVQVLFAFLLVLAFDIPITAVDTYRQIVFAAALVVAAMGLALLIGPVSVHRLLYRRRLRVELVRAAARMAIGGLVCLMLAVAGGLLLALDVMLPRSAAVAVACALMVWFVVLWYVVPITVRRRSATSSVSSEDADDA